MKTFGYEKSHVVHETMTVAELRDLLAEYSDDTPVLAMWEGCYACIHPDNFDAEHIDGVCDFLVVDVGYLICRELNT